jgi:hypothetical protein
VLADRHRQHRRGRREARHARGTAPLAISLSAHGKAIELQLTGAEHDIFDPDFRGATEIGANGTRTAIAIDTSLFYHGRVQDELESRVSVYIDPKDDTLIGVIYTPTEEYYIERADKYDIDGGVSNIIYRASDMVDVEGEEKNFEGTYYAKLTEAQDRIEKERAEAGHDTTIHHRARRVWNASTSGDTCEVKLIADSLFFEDRESDSRRCTMEMISLLDGASLIYRFTEFNPDGAPSPPPPGVVKLAVKDVDVYTTNANPLFGDVSCDDGAFCAQSYLDKLTTMENYNSFCLVHAFTNHDFVGGILGLAWVGRSGSNGAGICAQNYGGRSLNTGISTATNFDKAVSSAVATITLAHEFGHNFGSNHDTPGSSNGGSCAPDGTDGNYIMYLRATDGDKSNNDRFSPCSIQSINSVIRDNSDCFVTRPTNQCGLSLLPEGRPANSILEFGEECECTDASLTTESFCECATSTVQSDKVCSPATDPACCNSDGTLRGLSLEITLEKYREAFAIVAADPTKSVNIELDRLMTYDGGGKVETCGPESLPDCLMPRYCIDDEIFVPYRGQIYGSCPQADLVAVISDGADQADTASDFNVCFNFSFVQTADPGETRPQPKAVRSCKAVVKDQEGFGTNVSAGHAEPCYMFHKANTDTCNNGASLCRYNGCTGSICDNYVAINANSSVDDAERATPCATPASACKVACRFASTTGYSGLNPNAVDSELRPKPALSVCTVLGEESVETHYPGFRLAGYPQPMTERDLPNGRSCNFDGTSGSGKCNAGACEKYGGDLGDTLDPDAVAGWIVENWETVLIFVLVVIFVVVLLKCTYHKNKKQIRKGVRSAGARVAKTMGGKSGGGGPKPSNSRQDALRTLSRGTGRGGGPTVLTTQMRNDMRKVVRKEEQFMRLQAFFPNAKDKRIEDVQNRCTDEKDMVKRLLRYKEGLFIPSGTPVLLD